MNSADFVENPQKTPPYLKKFIKNFVNYIEFREKAIYNDF